MKEFEVGGYTFRTSRKLTVPQQMNIGRRIASAATGIVALIGEREMLGDTPIEAVPVEAKGEGDEPAEVVQPTKEGAVRTTQAVLTQLLSSAEPLLRALRDLSDEDVEYINKTCLSVVQVRIENDRGWANITAPNGNLMYEHLNDMYLIGQVIWEVIVENLGSFFLTRRPNSSPQGSGGQ